MVGASGTYAIEGTDIIQPFTHRWRERDSFGLDGNAHVIYSSLRSFEMSWPLMSTSDFAQLVAFYQLIVNTGTVAVDLPTFGATGFTFARYSGCVLTEPVFEGYFNGYVEGVSLLINKISG